MTDDFNFACDKCPRTFKLEDFFEKHKRVHDLKRQHRCRVCGFVYGALKGLQGHLNTHSESELAETAILDTDQPNQSISHAEDIPSLSQVPYNVNFHYLNSRGVLADANSNAMESNNDDGLIAATAEAADQGVRDSSPVGTGNYIVYDSLPEIPYTSSSSGLGQNDNGFFTCSICQREFSGLNSLKKHVPIHTRRIQHKCDICQFVFGKKEYLLDHARKHTGEMSPMCNICGQTFNKSQKLKDHSKIHRNTDDNTLQRPYKCHICNTLFEETSALGEHLKSIHNGFLYRCEICDATFGDVRARNHHLYNEHQLDAFHQKCVWCPVCSQGFTRLYNLKVHMFKSHGKDFIETRFTPNELIALTRPPPEISSSKLKDILFSINKEKSPPKPFFDAGKGTHTFSCHKCSQTFIRRNDYFIHLETVHDLLLLGCNLCDEKFLDMLQLKQHAISAHPTNKANAVLPMQQLVSPFAVGVGGVSETCPVMRKPGPASKTNAPIENRNEIYKCSQCASVFGNKKSHLEHVKRVHGGLSKTTPGVINPIVANILNHEAPFSVAQLSKTMKQLSEVKLPEHLLNSKSHTCKLCLKTFLNQTDLCEHMVNVHVNGFGFSCNICQKDFITAAELNVHTLEKHSLYNRLDVLRDALGLSSDVVVAEPAAKKMKKEEPPTQIQPSSKKKNTICRVCGVVLSPKTNVNVHMRTHSGVRPYQCVLCHNRFRQKAHLMKHFRCAHNQKTPPFKCMFCPDVFHSGSNDLYRHITDKHIKERIFDGATSVDINGSAIVVGQDQEEEMTGEDVFTIEVEIPEREEDMMAQEEVEVPVFTQIIQDDQSKEHNRSNEESAAVYDTSETDSNPDEEEVVRYEPILDEFLFDGQTITPCYVVLPFITDDEVEKVTSYHERQNIYDSDDELTIDEREMETVEEEGDQPSNEGEEQIKSLLQNLFQINKCSDSTIPSVDDEKDLSQIENDDDEDEQTADQQTVNPTTVGDLSLPFNMALMWREKLKQLNSSNIDTLSPLFDIMGSGINADQLRLMAKQIALFVGQNDEKTRIQPNISLVNHNNNNVDAKEEAVTAAKSYGSINGNNALVLHYEQRVQCGVWPIQCITCDEVLTNLELFNLHMNGHWSSNKCCAVCGLLINSKRFNFKQHLKIHTGEKPFVCHICNRSFRQKAHMVKHVSTHRIVHANINGGTDNSIMTAVN